MNETPCELRQRRRVVVLRVVLHDEHCGAGLADPLAVQELRVEPRCLVDAHVRELCGGEHRALRVGLDDPHAEPLVDEGAHDCAARAARAEDHDVVEAPLVLRERVAPRPRSVRRADDHDPVADVDRLVAARDDHAVAADDSGDLRVARDARLAQRHPHDAVPLVSALDVELDDLHLTVREDVRLARCRQADDPRDRVRRLELGRDHEVHVELALAPHLEIFLVGRPDDRARLRREVPREDRRDQVDLVTRGAGDHQVGLEEPSLLEGPAAGAVPLDRRYVEAIGERREAARVEVDDRHVVLAVQCLDDRCANLPGSDHEDPHDETG